MKELVKTVMKEEGKKQEALLKAKYEEFTIKAYEDITINLLTFNKPIKEFFKDVLKIEEEYNAQLEK